MSHITGVCGSQDLRSPSPIMTHKRNYSQLSLSIHARARKRERSKRGVGWLMGGGGGGESFTSEASRNTPLDAIMTSRSHGDDTFVAFEPMRFFRFWGNGEFTFFQSCLQLLYFIWSSPPTQSSLPLCASAQFSRDYVREFNNWIRIQENRALWTIWSTLCLHRYYSITDWLSLLKDPERD